MFTRIYGLDIETDTSPLTQEEIDRGYKSRGLDPAITRVVNAAVATEDGEIVFQGSERKVLDDLGSWFRKAEPGLIVTWNGSVFDLPFLQDRAKRIGVYLDLNLTFDERIVPKYEPLPGYPGGFTASWGSVSNKVPHAHLDVAYVFKNYAEEHSLSWSLKPVTRHFGLEPIEVDCKAIHELTEQEVAAYVASDARVTRALAMGLFAPEKDLLYSKEYMHP